MVVITTLLRTQKLRFRKVEEPWSPGLSGGQMVALSLPSPCALSVGVRSGAPLVGLVVCRSVR